MSEDDLIEPGATARIESDLEGVEDLDDLDRLAPAAPEDGDKSAPTVEPVIEFTVRDRVSGRTGTFVSAIPDVKTRIAMARLKVQLAGGFPFTALDVNDQNLIDCLVNCRFGLTQKPKWFTGIMTARELHVILAVGEEVAKHHRAWFRALGNLGPTDTYRALVEVTGGVGSDVPATEPR